MASKAGVHYSMSTVSTSEMQQLCEHRSTQVSTTDPPTQRGPPEYGSGVGLYSCTVGRTYAGGMTYADTPHKHAPSTVHISYIHKGKASPYSITKRGVPELIPVLGSQPAGDMSHKPGGRLPLLSVRPAVIPATLTGAATNFAAW